MVDDRTGCPCRCRLRGGVGDTKWSIEKVGCDSYARVYCVEVHVLRVARYARNSDDSARRVRFQGPFLLSSDFSRAVDSARVLVSEGLPDLAAIMWANIAAASTSQSMTTPDQVLNDLRNAVARINEGDDSDARFYVGVLERAAATIESLTKPVTSAPVSGVLAVGSRLKARDVPVGGLALDVDTRKGGSALVFHDRDDRGTWMEDEYECGHDWWPWGHHVCGVSDCIFLGYPAFTTRTCVRECMDVAADTSPDCRLALERVGLLK